MVERHIQQGYLKGAMRRVMQIRLSTAIMLMILAALMLKANFCSPVIKVIDEQVIQDSKYIYVSVTLPGFPMTYRDEGYDTYWKSEQDVHIYLRTLRFPWEIAFVNFLGCLLILFLIKLLLDFCSSPMASSKR